MTRRDNREAHSSGKIFGVKSLLFMLFERETKETGDAAAKVAVWRTYTLQRKTEEVPSFRSPESWASGGWSGFAY